MNNIKIRILTLFTCFLFILSGCGRGYQTRQKDGSTDELTIITSFYPIYLETINVTKDIEGVRVINMTQSQTGCLHDYSLTTENLKTLSDGDVFVVNGAGMESFLDKVVDQLPTLKIVDASQNIKLLSDKDGEKNAHVWVSVTNAMTQVDNIASQLSAIDPGHAQQYSANAKTYNDKLQALKDEMHSVIDNLPNKNIITFHEAFPYFAQEFNLNIAAVIEREPGTEPSAKELTETIEVINKTGIKALFAEPQYSSKVADTIASETGATIYYLDPIVTGKADANGYDDYINKMKDNLKALEEALK
jgi:zinc transport system substrate-binding protein